jgi:hypothetical protein
VNAAEDQFSLTREASMAGAAPKKHIPIHVSIISISLLLLLTLVEYRLLAVIYGAHRNGAWYNENLIDFIHKATGTTPYPYGAGRILLPRLARLVSPTNDFNTWRICVFGGILFANCTIYGLLRYNPTTRIYATTYTLLAAISFVGLRGVAGLAMEDIVDMTIWFLVAYIVFTAQTQWWLILLWVIELHNCERAHFIAIWGILLNVIPLPCDLKRGACALCWLIVLFAGQEYLHWLRGICTMVPLYNEGHPPILPCGLPIPIRHEQAWTLGLNWINLKQFMPGTPWFTLFAGDSRYDLWVAMGVMAESCLVVVTLKDIRLILFTGAYLLSTVLFAQLLELRFFHPLVLVISYAYFYFHHHPAHPTKITWGGQAGTSSAT